MRSRNFRASGDVDSLVHLLKWWCVAGMTGGAATAEDHFCLPEVPPEGLPSLAELEAVRLAVDTKSGDIVHQ